MGSVIAPLPPVHAPITGDSGKSQQAWYSFFQQLHQSSAAVAGLNWTILTPSGADDTAAITAAFSQDGVVAFMAGNYTSGAITSTKNLHIFGAPGMVNITAKAGLTQTMWDLRGRFKTIDGLTFIGPIYTAFGDVPSFDTILALRNPGWSPGAFVNSTRVQNCNFRGAGSHLVLNYGDDVWVQNNIFYRNYNDTIAIQGGLRGLRVINNHFSEAGIGSAVKTAATGQDQPYADFKYLGNTVELCGRLDPSTSGWQEGFDFAAASLTDVVVANNNFRFNGNGACEFKLANNSLAQVYSNFLIHDNIVLFDVDHGVGFALNWVSGNNHVARNAILSNNRIIYLSGVATSINGVQITTWDDVKVQGNVFDGMSNAVLLYGVGTADQTVRRARICDNAVLSGDSGIFQSAGIAEAFEISGNDINVNGVPVYITNGSGRCGPNTRLGSATTNAARFDAGNPVFFERNRCEVGSTRRGHFNGGATVYASDNVTGYSSATPGNAGAWGDVMKVQEPAAAGACEFRITTPGDAGSAVWGAVNLA